MPEGGRITIETDNCWIDRQRAEAQDMPEGPYLSLCVSDTGTGMPPAVVARAFDPFFTTKPMGEGTGLGLSMIYGFAKQSGGQVRINSTVGRGTNVCIYLPRHFGEADADGPDPGRGRMAPAEAGEDRADRGRRADGAHAGDGRAERPRLHGDRGGGRRGRAQRAASRARGSTCSSRMSACPAA